MNYFHHMRVFICMIGLLASTVGWAQNLVPNGSFEEYIDCPMGMGQWPQVVGWTSPYTQSADYFNACAGNDLYGVPYNQCGYQEAADGQAYVGVVTYVADNAQYREFMAAQLPQPLQIGVPICLSFKMAMGGFGSLGFANSARYTAKRIGLKFFNALPITSHPWMFSEWASYLYPNSAALYLDVVPTDTAIWYHVSGTYEPDSAYRYLVVGNFFTDSLCDPFLFDTVGYGNWNVAYAFIDDVRASYDLTYCDLPSGVSEKMTGTLKVMPNPFMEELVVEVPYNSIGSWDLYLFNNMGAIVHSSYGNSGPLIKVSGSTLVPGIYHLSIIGASGLHYSAVTVKTTH